MAYPTCFVCHQTVLELTGQDIVCQEYFLEDDAHVIQAVSDAEHYAAGHCHIKCLKHSRWGMLWAEGFRKHFSTTRNYQLVNQNLDWTVLRDRWNSMMAIRYDGEVLFFDVDKLRHAIATEQGYLLPVVMSFTIDPVGYAPQPALYEAVQQRWSQDGYYPLIEMIQFVGVEDELLYPEAILTGKVVQAEVDPEDAGHWLDCEAHYHVFIPQEVYDLCSDL
jgi:hypothetical protein